MKTLTAIVLVASVICATSASADSTAARCDIYAAGSDHTDVMIPCRFSQRQGFITIARSDGVTHELEPADDAVGNFTDQDGHKVYRQSGLGDQGLIFRFPKESVFVYWSTAGLEPEDSDNPTAPFSTKDYDATTLLDCKAIGDTAFGSCPAGVLRMEDGQGSVTVQSKAGERFTINFMKDYVNASNREVKAHLDGDMWTVTIDGKDVYQLSQSFIIGG